MTDAADLEIALDVPPRDRRAVLEMRSQCAPWAIAAYLEIEVIQVEAVIRCADDGTLPCPGDDDILAHEALAGWQGALTHEGAGQHVAYHAQHRTGDTMQVVTRAEHEALNKTGSCPRCGKP